MKARSGRGDPVGSATLRPEGAGKLGRAQAVPLHGALELGQLCAVRDRQPLGVDGEQREPVRVGA